MSPPGRQDRLDLWHWQLWEVLAEIGFRKRLPDEFRLGLPHFASVFRERRWNSFDSICHYMVHVPCARGWVHQPREGSLLLCVIRCWRSLDSWRFADTTSAVGIQSDYGLLATTSSPTHHALRYHNAIGFRHDNVRRSFRPATMQRTATGNNYHSD